MSSPSRVLLAGASGLIGQSLRDLLTARGYSVHTLVRRPARTAAEHQWDPERGVLPAAAIESADAVISLNGANLRRLPWTGRYREQLVHSRVRPTEVIAAAIGATSAPPAVWVSGSAVGFYGDRPGETLTDDAAKGTGFLSDLVDRWEAATSAAGHRTRVVHARTGIVLSESGALAPLFTTAKFFLATRMGSGRQHWPWISLADETRALAFLALESTLAGAVNLVAPQPATADEITRELARQLHRPYVVRAPTFALRAVLGTAADELLLADQRAVPTRLLTAGFTFENATLASGIRAGLD